MIHSHKSIENFLKDNSIGDFYDDWSIEATCDTISLESNHPFKHPDSNNEHGLIYTHECKDDEIAYFKVDVNLISNFPLNYLGNV